MRRVESEAELVKLEAKAVAEEGVGKRPSPMRLVGHGRLLPLSDL